MIAATVGFLLGAAAMQLLGRGINFGNDARRERDNAIAALRELIVAMHGRGLDSHSSQREARAWARARAVLAAYLRRRGQTLPTPAQARRDA